MARFCKILAAAAFLWLCPALQNAARADALDAPADHSSHRMPRASGAVLRGAEAQVSPDSQNSPAPLVYDFPVSSWAGLCYDSQEPLQIRQPVRRKPRARRLFLSGLSPPARAAF
jgi:hypothetical protein